MQYTPSPDPSNQSPTSFGSPAPEKKPVGPVAGIIIVILLMIAGGLYFWGAAINAKNGADTNTPPLILGNDVPGSDTEAGLPAQSSSDELSSIETDLNAMDMTQFEAQAEGSVSAFDQAAQ